MKIEIKGMVHAILDTQTFASGFQKRVLVVSEPHPQYPQFIPVEFTKDNVSKLDALKVGQEVQVTCDLGGNEYNGKYYANIRAWKIAVGTVAAASETAPPATNYSPDSDTNPPF